MRNQGSERLMHQRSLDGIINFNITPILKMQICSNTNDMPQNNMCITQFSHKLMSDFVQKKPWGECTKLNQPELSHIGTEKKRIPQHQLLHRLSYDSRGSHLLLPLSFWFQITSFHHLQQLISCNSFYSLPQGNSGISQYKVPKVLQ